ncbi:MAG: TetR/AcrR family transcriptional regulator [Pseudomonadota bacterium]
MSNYHHGNLRNAVIERAIAVIGADGVEALSLRKIAKDLGVSHAAPARHFKAKSDLLAAIVADAYAELTKSVLAASNAAGKSQPIRRLNLMAQGTIFWALENKAKFSAMMNPDVSRFADEQLKSSLREFAQVIADALSDAQQHGFRKNVSGEVLLIYAVGAAQGVSAVLTDDLLGSVIGVEQTATLVEAIADQIVPA